MDLSQTSIFHDFAPDEQLTVLELAEELTIPAGETLFREDDVSKYLYLHQSGKCMLSRNAIPMGEANRNQLLDPIATLGGLPHTIRAVAITDCHFLRWLVDDLWQNPAFAIAARQHMAEQLLQTQSRLEQLAAPVHYQGDSAQLPPGPFVFKNMTMILALCDANLDSVRAMLPPGLSLFRPTWRRRDSLFIALADFPLSYPAHNPDAVFNYTETTCFVPVRYKGKLGLFVPYIYPSTYEPTLLGREIYGFPKRLGETIFDGKTVSLAVDGERFFDFAYNDTSKTSEPRLVRALSDWIGVPGHVTEAAFRIGDNLLNAMRVPLYRRISVYNHKRIAAANSMNDEPSYDVDALTRAIFSVTHWHEIAKISDPILNIIGGPLKNADVVLREAYYTKLNMRLSTGITLKNYNED